jgi:lysophospholipase L1-like esterase
MIKKISIPLLFVLFTTFTVTAQQTADDPDPLRFEAAIEQFKSWDQKNSRPADPILFVGSSSIRFWKTAEAFPRFPVINRGFGGSHISDVQHYYDAVIGKYEPKLIVFYEGDNDIAAGKSVDQVLGDYKQLIERILSDKPEAQFLFIPIKPSSSRWNYWPEMQEVNQRIKNYNKQNDRLHYVDLATPVLNAEGTPNDSLFLDDQLHLNESGYAKWNSVLRPVLEKLVKK